ncbi:YdiU domain protein [Aspergillus clavatus NRRL 1]|uniref:Selenoprotein O n=1 Tax=Aspergillus clavatus (strain ATCC 1007 / CBS 513.65 / DSM 816 / NCTC 3887 / NRRL 1 / QM 1276 / 107) TaxID=344612 RepID=A1CQQ2_ASPCL|nr:YdiU domain protein [Aspergillus clavatus NRRL 1]EAW07973.1 YdiU domain protein [Aspergillus clavatus NRRL 1]
MRNRLSLMASQLSSSAAGASIMEIPKSNMFTTKLPPDPAFETPESSHRAPREALGPRLVKGAMYTFVRPEPSEETELLGVSQKAMRDLGLKDGEELTPQFQALVSGNKICWNEREGGVYPWAQCYGALTRYSGSWAGQLGDGRAISLFECTNPETNRRFELQLKGAGKTPYSRFADGKAVLRSSIREFIVSEALSALGVPTTRALSITLLPKSKVLRERIEPGAIVARFAESWLRIGSFDLPHARGDRDLIRKLATYIAEDVFGGWDSLPAAVSLGQGHPSDAADNPGRGIPRDRVQEHQGVAENRFARTYREIVRRNAKTVAVWQAYGFMNGVLNTDNTSIYGLSLDFGPFAFMDNFDPHYTPNHDDHLLRYSYKNQPTIIWWNLVRLGEALGELMGAGDKVDEEWFLKDRLTEETTPPVVKLAETIIERAGDEYKTVFLNEYKRLMSRRLGLRTQKESDFQELFSEMLDTLEALELDFNHFFRRLSNIPLSDIESKEQRRDIAHVFFHREGFGGVGDTEDSARERISKWLASWRIRILEDWGMEHDTERQKAMRDANPKFLPRGWILDEVIERVERKGDREILGFVMQMALDPFKEDWGLDKDEEERLCGDVPRFKRAMMCSCSS